jgi:hypothetical protein
MRICRHAATVAVSQHKLLLLSIKSFTTDNQATIVGRGRNVGAMNILCAAAGEVL